MGVLAAATAFFVLVVALLATTLLRLGRMARPRIPGAATATGVVVGEVVRSPSATRPAGSSNWIALHFPQVRFTVPDGRESTFTSDFGTSVRTTIGQEVQVLYDPADPSRAQISPESQPRQLGCWRGAMWAFLGGFVLLGMTGLTIAWLVATRLD